MQEDFKTLQETSCLTTGQIVKVCFGNWAQSVLLLMFLVTADIACRFFCISQPLTCERGNFTVEWPEHSRQLSEDFERAKFSSILLLLALRIMYYIEFSFITNVTIFKCSKFEKNCF